jgi:transposase-like protein
VGPDMGSSFEIAHDLGVSSESLRIWVKQVGVGSRSTTGPIATFELPVPGKMRFMALQQAVERRDPEDRWEGVTLHAVILWDIVVWLAIVEQLVWWLA